MKDKPKMVASHLEITVDLYVQCHYADEIGDFQGDVCALQV
jgi:hypothetical protein